jgi:hypothetical protein
VKADVKKVLNHLLQAEGIAPVREPGGNLYVENPARNISGVLEAQGEILLSGVDNRLRFRIADQLPDRLQVEVQERVNDADGISCRDLKEADLRFKAILHDELGVEGESPLVPTLLAHRDQVLLIFDFVVLERRSAMTHGWDLQSF